MICATTIFIADTDDRRFVELEGDPYHDIHVFDTIYIDEGTYVVVNKTESTSRHVDNVYHVSIMVRTRQ